MPQFHFPEQYAHKDHIYTLWTFPMDYILQICHHEHLQMDFRGLYGAYKNGMMYSSNVC